MGEYLPIANPAALANRVSWYHISFSTDRTLINPHAHHTVPPSITTAHEFSKALQQRTVNALAINLPINDNRQSTTKIQNGSLRGIHESHDNSHNSKHKNYPCPPLTSVHKLAVPRNNPPTTPEHHNTIPALQKLPALNFPPTAVIPRLPNPSYSESVCLVNRM